MSTFRRVVEGKQLTVADLIAVLRTLPAEHTVGAYSDCHDCGGESLSISVGDWVVIAGDVPR